MEETFVYQLNETFKYSKKGDFVETATIEFSAPNMESFDESTSFEQIIMGAMVSASKIGDSGKEVKEEKKGKKEIEPEMTADAVKKILYISQDIKIKDVAEIFKKLAVKVGTLDGSVPLKKDHFNKFSKEDFMGMLTGYASFFTCPLLLKEG